MKCNQVFFNLWAEHLSSFLFHCNDSLLSLHQSVSCSMTTVYMCVSTCVCISIDTHIYICTKQWITSCILLRRLYGVILYQGANHYDASHIRLNTHTHAQFLQWESCGWLQCVFQLSVRSRADVSFQWMQVFETSNHFIIFFFYILHLIFFSSSVFICWFVCIR